jgi:hypothetical protein
MGIINITPGQTGLVGVLPSVAYINTDDTVAEVTTTGYLNKEVANGLQISLPCIAAVSTKATPTSVPQVGWYEVQHIGSNWSLDAGSNTGIALTDGHIFVGNASNVAADVAMSGDISITNAGVTAIVAGVIVNADINAAAAIAFSKLAALPSAQILVGSAGNVPTAVAMTGDVTISNTGVTSIAALSIVNADISATAAIDFSKLAALTSGNILVGSVGTVPTSVAMSGDATIIASGALTIANDAITTVKILNANVTLAKLASGITPSHVIKFANQVTTVGGAATEAFTVTGAAAATDRAFVQVVNNGTGNVTVLEAVVTDNTLTITFSADPQNDTVFNYQLIRVAS